MMETLIILIASLSILFAIFLFLSCILTFEDYEIRKNRKKERGEWKE